MNMKLFEKANKQQLTGQMDVKENAPLINAEYKFSKFGGESDFYLMCSKNSEQIMQSLSDENKELKECLK